MYHTKGDLVYWADAKTHEMFDGLNAINNKVLEVVVLKKLVCPKIQKHTVVD